MNNEILREVEGYHGNKIFISNNGYFPSKNEN